jgi:hypothetical protein
MDDGGGEFTEIHGREHQSRHDLDADTDREDRVRARAREDAGSTLARLWNRLRRALRRD